MDFGISIWHIGLTSHVRCVGPLDPSTSEKLRDAVEMVLETSPQVLELDCRKVHSLSVSAVDALIRVAAYGQVRGTEIKIWLNEDARRITHAFAGEDLEPWVQAQVEQQPHRSFLSLVHSAERPVSSD